MAAAVLGARNALAVLWTLLIALILAPRVTRAETTVAYANGVAFDYDFAGGTTPEAARTPANDAFTRAPSFVVDNIASNGPCIASLAVTELRGP